MRLTFSPQGIFYFLYVRNFPLLKAIATFLNVGCWTNPSRRNSSPHVLNDRSIFSFFLTVGLIKAECLQ